MHTNDSMLVAIHAGAGYHTEDSEHEVRRAMRLYVRTPQGPQIANDHLGLVKELLRHYPLVMKLYIQSRQLSVFWKTSLA